MRRLWVILLLVMMTIPAMAQAQDPTAIPTPLAVNETITTLPPVQQAQFYAEEARQYAEEARGAVELANTLMGLFQNVTAITGIIVPALAVVGGLIGLNRINAAQRELNAARRRANAAYQKVDEELEIARGRFAAEMQQKEADLAELRAQFEQTVEAQRRELARATLALSLLPLGERQYRAQDFDGAMDTYRRALELDEQNPVTHLRLGYVSTQAGKLEEARHHLTRALEIEPDFAPALAALGYVYRRIGEKMTQNIERDEMLNQAEGKLLQALRLSPMLVDDDGESWWGSLGGLYRRRGQTDQAIKAYEQAAVVTPHSSYPFSNLALLYMQTDNRERMLSTYKRVERLARGETQAEVDNYWAHSDLLVAQLALGKVKEAENAFQSVLDTAPPSSPYVLDMLIDTLQRLAEALKGEESAAHIPQFIARLKSEVSSRKALQT